MVQCTKEDLLYEGGGIDVYRLPHTGRVPGIECSSLISFRTIPRMQRCFEDFFPPQVQKIVLLRNAYNIYY